MRIHTGVAVSVLAATAAAAFALGRAAPPEAATPQDLAVAIRAALAEPDLLTRVGQSAVLLERLDPATLPAVREVYDEMLPLAGQWEIRPFVAAWARFDPAGALDHTIAWPLRLKREIGVEAAMEGFALRDPPAAREAFERLSAEHRALHEKLLIGLVSGWVHSGQEGFDAFLAELPPASLETATGIAVGALMRKGGPDVTIAWVYPFLRGEHDVALERSVFRRATRSVARVDPERAAAWALEHAGNEYAADGPRIVAEQWGARDGRAALAWVREHASGPLRDPAMREGFVAWLRADPRGAKAWLESETLTEFHDPALDVYGRRLAERAPEEAIRWCERIASGERRRGCLVAAATAWYRRDSVAAEAWLQQSPLDDAARHVARRAPPQRQRGGRGALRRGPAADPS